MNQIARSCRTYRVEIDQFANTSEFLSPLPDISSLEQEYRQAKKHRGQRNQYQGIPPIHPGIQRVADQVVVEG